ncbi:MAG: DinB family protein [Dehalococcoidia bacterium]
MTSPGVEQVLYLLDQAFEGNDEHSLLANLRSVAGNDWLWTPPGGDRSVFDIVQHTGDCKYVYQSHAFGDGSMRWDAPGSTPTIERETPRADVTAWLVEGQRRLRESVAALTDDAELTKPRLANWGQEYETRWLISVMIEHDLYHAGEINHLRALRQGNDRWAWLSDSPTR